MSPRIEADNQRIRDERREQILAAAATVFASNGYAGTKIYDIAAAAEMSKGLVYHYFAGKDAVFVTLVRRAVQGTEILIQQAISRDGTPWEKLSWMISQMLTGMQESPDEFMLILQAFTSKAVPHQAREIVTQQTTWYSIRALIVEGQAAHQVRDGDPDQLTAVFSACIQGLAVSAAAPIAALPHFPDADSVLQILKAPSDPPPST